MNSYLKLNKTRRQVGATFISPVLSSHCTVLTLPSCSKSLVRLPHVKTLGFHHAPVVCLTDLDNSYLSSRTDDQFYRKTVCTTHEKCRVQVMKLSTITQFDLSELSTRILLAPCVGYLNMSFCIFPPLFVSNHHAHLPFRGVSSITKYVCLPTMSRSLKVTMIGLHPLSQILCLTFQALRFSWRQSHWSMWSTMLRLTTMKRFAWYA